MCGYLNVPLCENGEGGECLTFSLQGAAMKEVDLLPVDIRYRSICFTSCDSSKAFL